MGTGADCECEGTGEGKEADSRVGRSHCVLFVCKCQKYTLPSRVSRTDFQPGGRLSSAPPAGRVMPAGKSSDEQSDHDELERHEPPWSGGCESNATRAFLGGTVPIARPMARVSL